MELLEPTFRSDCTVKLVDSMGDEDSIVNAARVSSNSDASKHDPERNKGLLRSLLREGHGSPTEHVELEFYIETPIFVARQILKYRHSSINERSGRYTNVVPEFYVPENERPLYQVGPTMRYEFEQAPQEVKDELVSEMKELATSWWKCYTRRRENGIAKEVARMDMPLNGYTAMYFKVNLREAIHFITQRIYMPDAATPSHGQYEIEMVAREMLAILEPMFPTVFGAVREANWAKL